MIDKVRLKYFKRFEDEIFDLSNVIILAGPNNSGKSTLLQAISVWNLALRKWLAEKWTGSGSKAKQRKGVAITRKDFTAVPLREMNLLWTNRSTGLSKAELGEKQKLGTPKKLSIELSGKIGDKKWALDFEFTYRYPDLIHAGPSAENPAATIDIVKDLEIIHIPPFSGIGAEETRYDIAYQNLLVGQGKPGDILRNLLLELSNKKEDWKSLCDDIKEIFDYELLPPLYEAQPFILCEYKPGVPHEKGLPKLDIASAGSGFLQVLMLLGFFYARPASILLIDEPDAHLHIILQKQVYDRLRKIAHNRGCKLLIATHSEVLIDGTSPERIVSFFHHPHKLSAEQSDKDQVQMALKHLTSIDILLAEQSGGILYLEDESDLNLLREFARVLNHDAYNILLKQPFWHAIKGSDPKIAKSHFFALRTIKSSMRGIIILDGDNRDRPDHELYTQGLEILRWKRYEIENYLIHPKALRRFLATSGDLFTMARVKPAMDFLQEQLAPAVYKNPLEDHEYLNKIGASKEILPEFFKIADKEISKSEYFQIAASMDPNEIPLEIGEKLDTIYNLFSNYSSQ